MKKKLFDVNAPGCSIRCCQWSNVSRDFDRIVLAVHGFAGHKESSAIEKFAQMLLERHKTAAVISFDLPCHGSDIRKKISLGDCDRYIGHMLEHIAANYPQADLCCYATSFGGYLCLRYLKLFSNPFRRVFLRCPALVIYRVMTEKIMGPKELEAIAQGKIAPVGFDRKVPVSGEFLDELKNFDLMEMDFIPFAEDIMICHGTADEIVPVEASREFADNNVIEFSEVSGADHRFINPAKMTGAIKQALSFLYE